VREIIAVDFFVVPTVRNQILFDFLLLAHDRRRVIHYNVTANPTAAWTAQQIVEAFPWQDPPKYLLRDRDKIHGKVFRKRVAAVGFEELLTAARSPWQNPYVERLIGTIRRDCRDHVIVVNERHLRRILSEYFHHYHRWRVHRSLEMDCPEPRKVHEVARGRVIETPEVGGLHQHYESVAA
jgi:putative transposase